MPYRFTIEDGSLQAALRRLAEDELGAALSHLAGPGPIAPQGVHDVRKRVKKLRGLIRLLRPGFADFAAENAALREAGQALATLRDAEVRLATFDRLWNGPPPAPLAPLRVALAAARDAHPADRTPEAAAALAGLRDRARGWRLRGRDREILAEGLATTRSRARTTMAKAADSREIEAMHDWRKRAKDHWYQARLLAPIWPEMMQPVIAAAERLTEDLGDHHDLALLGDHAEAEGGLSGEAVTLLRLRLAAAATAIEDRVFPLGRRLFAGKPDAMADLWLRWWTLWRG